MIIVMGTFFTFHRFGMLHKGDEETWKTMLKRYQSETNAQEKSKLLQGLAWIDQPWILERFIRLAKNETIVRRQDYFTCLRYIGQNPIGMPLVWNFLRDEWPYLVERFSLNDRYLGRMPQYLTHSFSSQFRLNEIKDFFKKYPDAGAGMEIKNLLHLQKHLLIKTFIQIGKRSRLQAIEKIQNNIKWLENHEETIGKWLHNNS